MGKTCCVPFCTSNQKVKNVSYHEFPSNLPIRQIWLDKISRAGSGKFSTHWVPSDRDVVCSLHFVPENYKCTEKRKKLHQTAVPSLFPGYPKYKLKEVKPERKPPINRTVKRKLFKNNMILENFECLSPRKVQCKSEVSDICEEDISTHKYFTPKICNEDEKNVSQKNAFDRQKKTFLQTIRRKNQAIKKLNFEIRKLRKALQPQNSMLNNKLQIVEAKASSGDRKAAVLLEQITSYGKKVHVWSEFMIRMSVLYRSKSPKGYDTARSLFMNLPSRTTLRRYIGPSRLLVGFTPLVAARLKDEIAHLKSEETFASLIFDEMAISPEVTYVRQADKIIGSAQLGKNTETYEEKSAEERAVKTISPIANRLLCFVLKGLSTNYRIPVAYYLTRQLQGEQLAKVIKNVLYEVESIGFRVCRLVADCLSVNVKAFSILCNGKVSPKTIHPVDPRRLLFISFDACHVLKNIRNQFLDGKRILRYGKQKISGEFIKKYEIQKSMISKPVRHLTRKVVYPTNFEKMNIGRAIKIFSTETIAALKLPKNKTTGFGTIKTTIAFMENVKKWFDIQNITNKTHYIHCRNTDKAPFEVIDDDRLEWLEKTFTKYLEDWKNSIKVVSTDRRKKKWPSHTFTQETYTALQITTLSTVQCTRYLLEEGFLFVLTRKFTSDDVESLFAAVRSFQGGNDKANAVGSLYALEKILKIGLMSGSKSSNTENQNEVSVLFVSKVDTVNIHGKPGIIQLNEKERELANNLKEPPCTFL